MKIGDLVRHAPDVYKDESVVGIVLETDVNMWGEEVIPSGVRVLWPEDITVEPEDELEVYND
jgi:hypothetical protein